MAALWPKWGERGGRKKKREKRRGKREEEKEREKGEGGQDKIKKEKVTYYWLRTTKTKYLGN